MKAHPILFSGPMVQAVLTNRKTVTRRLSKQWLKVKAGDLLWVRETLARPKGEAWVYVCGRDPVVVDKANETAMLVWSHHRAQPYCPSIHMPRWASRIMLRATEDARLERLQNISEDDAQREGVERSRCGQAGYAMEPLYSYRTGFVRIWHDLHTKPGERWEDNPEVVRIGFEREHGV